MINVMGVRLSMHPVFVLLMMLSVATGQFVELITLFVIVFVHELGHASAAALLGIKVNSIQMLPFGGVAVIEDRGDLTAGKEILISLAGPLQNVIMMGAAAGMLSLHWWDGEFLIYFIEANAIIALFNLLPILPLDGGKITQAWVSLFLPYYKTLIITYRLSIVASVVMIMISLSPLLMEEAGKIELNILLMGCFLLYSGIEDYRNIPYRFLRFLVNRDKLFTYHLSTASLAQPIISIPAKPLDAILRLFKREKYHMIYVMNAGGKIIGVLPEQRIIESYFEKKG